MLSIRSGRVVPPNPGCVGVITRPPLVVARRLAKTVTDCGRAPPRMSRNGCPGPVSLEGTGVGPSASIVSSSVVSVLIGFDLLEDRSSVLSASLSQHVDISKLILG